MSKEKYPQVSGGTDDRGRVVESEEYDKGYYTEKITRVTNGDKVDVYVDKTSK